MTTPPGGPADPTHIKVYENAHALVELTGPSGAAGLRRAADWLDTFDGAVPLLAANWGGDIGEFFGEDPNEPLYKLDQTVDMSIAAHEGRWPRDWFNSPG